MTATLPAVILSEVPSPHLGHRGTPFLLTHEVTMKLDWLEIVVLATVLLISIVLAHAALAVPPTSRHINVLHISCASPAHGKRLIIAASEREEPVCKYYTIR
jgi:hypothetical protein